MFEFALILLLRIISLIWTGGSWLLDSGRLACASDCQQNVSKGVGKMLDLVATVFV